MSRITEREKEEIVRRGIALFREGYNCAQSTVLAMAPYYALDEKEVSRLVCGLGAGMGRMRLQCGAATGIFMLCGMETATSEPSRESKAHTYAAVQDLARRFKAATGSLNCQELLAGYVREIQTTPIPEERTEEYYKARPCSKMIEKALRIYFQWLEEREKE